MVDLQPDDEEEASTYEARPWSTVSVLLSLTSDSFPDLAPLPALANLLSPLDCPLFLSLSLFMVLLRRLRHSFARGLSLPTSPPPSAPTSKATLSVLSSLRH